jgi:hypothetical protein
MLDSHCPVQHPPRCLFSAPCTSLGCLTRGFLAVTATNTGSTPNEANTINRDNPDAKLNLCVFVGNMILGQLPLFLGM